jgi:signal transduction histidine kinase
MLGRQQIAGIPTAISELFKNAYDAYADHVVVDFFRKDALFILRDDGCGMTEEEFVKRWLTLGTENKFVESRNISGTSAGKGKGRPILGEKGIGRLAIASIGPQVLILTRSKSEKGGHSLVAAYINWKVFELPGLDLSDVVVPIKVFEGGCIPAEKDILDLTEQVIASLKVLEQKGVISPEDADAVINLSKDFKVNPAEIYRYLEGPSLEGDNYGTHFIIKPVDPILSSLIDEDGDNAAPLVKYLIGFTNTMVPGSKTPEINAVFRDYKSDEGYKDIIERGEFFTQDEFLGADHHLLGDVDEKGTFRGQLSVFKGQPKDVAIEWKQGKGKITQCGPFKFSFAYLQGEKWSTKVTPIEYANISKKLERICGLYIYKNGIRVLPYGDSDYDFLEIEKRRSKGAGYYFFSYRRMFGAIEISEKNNLIEKAGREGFIQDRAFKQFKDICINILNQLTSRYFREEDSEWAIVRDQLKKQHQTNKEREELAKKARKACKKGLSDFFLKRNLEQPERDINEILVWIEKELNSIQNTEDPEISAKKIEWLGNSANQKIAHILDNMRVIRPEGFALDDELKMEWNSYEKSYERMVAEVITPARLKIETLVSESLSAKRLKIDKVRRAKESTTFFVNAIDGKIADERNELNSRLVGYESDIQALVDPLCAEIRDKNSQMLNDVVRLASSDASDMEIMETRLKQEQLIRELTDKHLSTIRKIRMQIDRLAWRRESGEVMTLLDEEEALEEELIFLRQQIEEDFEVCQLGTAVSVIHHEFGTTVNSLRDSIEKLKGWADLNPQLVPLYKNLSNSFEQLDSYLMLFTPLNKRMYVKEVELKGDDIKKYLDDIFIERLESKEIGFEITDAFSRKTTIGYPSHFYPAFVNIVDNAFFWLKDFEGNKKIVLDADEAGYYISNNGPAIQDRDKELIFKKGFTRKPAGRGLGLYISKEALSKAGYELKVDDNPRPGMTVTFSIMKVVEANRA